MSAPAPQAPAAPHAHDAAPHAGHSHAHGPDHNHASHTHGPRQKAARPPLAARLFAAGAAQRLLIAIVPLALVWALTWWALQ
ncbi:hypothetical protein JCM19000A_20980 [Silvimonas sp. JCM 19000]